MLNIYTRYVGKEEKKLIVRVLEGAYEFLGQTADMELDLSFVGQDFIRSVNSDSRGVDKVTDVLSFPVLEGIKGELVSAEDFPCDVNPDTECLMLGEIIICKHRAKQQAEEYGHSLERELAFLSLHGFLHLMGYDHIEEADRIEMEDLSKRILNKLEIKRENA